MEKPRTQHLRGLALMIGIAAIAFLISELTGFLNAVIWGLVLGIIGGNLFRVQDSFLPGIRFSEKTILAYAIILMGFPTGWSMHSSAPISIAIIVLIVMAVTILSGLVLRKVFGLSKEDGLLMGVGNAVCGASAIAAISGIIKADPKSTGMSIAVINILGIVGLFVIPPLLISYQTDVMPSALLTGGTLQALGQAVAAGEAVSPEAGGWATTIKLFRVSMLLPIAFIVALTFGRKSNSGPSLKLIPSFLWLFILTAIAGYFYHPYEDVKEILKPIEHGLLAIAMTAIGWQVQFRKLKTEGPKALLFGTIIFMIEVGAMIALITINPLAIEF